MKIPLDKMRNGDLVLFHGRGFQPVSWGIRVLTGSYWNHAGIYKENIYTEGGQVIEALKGVVKTPISKYTDSKQCDLGIFRVKRSAYETENGYKNGLKTATGRAEEFVGVGYDYGAIVYLGIKYLSWGFLRRIIPQRWNPFHSRFRFFCSELVCQCFYSTSFKVRNLFVGKRYLKAGCSTITPKDIAKSENVEYVAGTNKI